MADDLRMALVEVLQRAWDHVLARLSCRCGGCATAASSPVC
jgi:hypothetical protein